MKLFVDAGNTRIKWGMHDGAGWTSRGTLAHGEVPHLAEQLQGVTAAVVASVAGPQVDTALQNIFDAAGITALWVSASSGACGVVNGYAQPGQLGCDRWTALIAAWKLKQDTCVVATAGTALTVDALSPRGEFIGGLIVPGLAMMKGALAANTAGVAKLDGRLADFPANTGDAVHSGALKAMAGAVEQVRASLEKREGRKPELLLSGGDAALLQAALGGAGEIVDNLVLEGLVIILKDIAV